MILLYFFLGGIYTVLLLAIGMLIGYLMGTKKITKKIEAIKTKLIKEKPTSGEPLKAITPIEKEKEKQQSFTSRMAHLLSDK